MEPPLKSRFPWIIPDALQALASNTGIGVPDSEGVLNSVERLDTLTACTTCDYGEHGKTRPGLDP